MAKTLNELIKEKGIQKIALARLMGISPSGLTFKIRGERPLRAQEWGVLSGKLDVPVEDLKQLVKNNSVDWPE